MNEINEIIEKIYNNNGETNDDMYIGESAEDYARRKKWQEVRWRGWEYADAPEHPDLKNPDPDIFDLVEIDKQAIPGGPPVRRLLLKEGKGKFRKGKVFRKNNETLVRRWFVEENPEFEIIVLFCSNFGNISLEKYNE